MSFLEHLEELRWHLVRISLAIFILATVVFLYKSFFIDTVLLGPRSPVFPTYQWFCSLTRTLGVPEVFCFSEPTFELLNTKMAGQFATHIWIAIMGGVILAFPYSIWEIWRFVAPGLSKRERRATRGIVFSSTLLFFLGVLFGYYLIVPLSVQFLGTYTVSEEVVNRIDLLSFLRTVSSITFSGGILFQLPVIVYFLSRSGLLTPKWMKTYRRHAIVVVLVLSAIITPPDVLSQILVTLPILVLYELSIGISRRQQNKRERREI
jgi:sec-independent protein translocase protein TatC